MSTELKKRLFNVDEFHLMIKAGILKTDDRVELVDGEIINMPPIGPPHAANIDRLLQLFYLKYGKDLIIRVQSPIQLDYYSEPQPDIALLKPKANFYADAHPNPDDIYLIIEVSDSTVEKDRKEKLPRYAQAKIVETWLFDIQKNIIELHRQPYNGIYQEIRLAQKGQQIASLAFPHIYFAVDDLLIIPA